MSEIIIRHLIGISIYATSKNDSELVLIKSDEVETDSNSLIKIPKISIFDSGTELSIELKYLEERKYKESLSNKGMIELIK